jgi:hypothetical protein
MKPLKGINLDVEARNQPEGTTRLARNIVNHKDYSRSNEKGFDEITGVKLATNQKLVGVIESSDGIAVIFSYYTDSGTSEIGILSESNGLTYDVIVKDFSTAPSESDLKFNFDVNSPITGEV